MPIEVEVRGPLNKKEFKKFYGLIEKSGKFVDDKDRISIIYFRNRIPKCVSEIKAEKVDLRVRITNKKSEMIIKYGSWGSSDTRKEVSIPIDLDHFEKAIEFLNCLGWNTCVVYVTKTRNYIYKGIDFALVEIEGFDESYYEAEILVEDEEDINKTEDRIRQICKKLNLREYEDKKFEYQCNKINNNKKLQFDFKKDGVNSIREKFKEFF